MTPEEHFQALIKNHREKIGSSLGEIERNKLAIKSAKEEVTNKLKGIDKHDYNNLFLWREINKILNKI